MREAATVTAQESEKTWVGVASTDEPSAAAGASWGAIYRRAQGMMS